MLDKDVQSLGFLTNKKITEATDAVREDVAEHGEKQRQELLDHVETKVNSLGDYITQRLKSDYEQVNQSIAEQSSGGLVKTQAELEASVRTGLLARNELRAEGIVVVRGLLAEEGQGEAASLNGWNNCRSDDPYNFVLFKIF